MSKISWTKRIKLERFNEYYNLDSLTKYLFCTDIDMKGEFGAIADQIYELRDYFEDVLIREIINSDCSCTSHPVKYKLFDNNKYVLPMNCVVESEDAVKKKKQRDEFIDLSLIHNKSILKVANELNKAYNDGLDSATFALCRKLVENYIIDVIKKFYPSKKSMWMFTDKKSGVTKIHNYTNLVDKLFSNHRIFTNINISTYKKTIDEIKEKFLEIAYETNPVIHSASMYPTNKQIEELRKTTEIVLLILNQLST